MTEPVPERRGGCLCGAVRFVAKGKPLWSAHCHCESCRRATSAALATYAGYPRDQVVFTKQQPATYQSSPGVIRSFCAACGTPMSYESKRWPREVHLFLCSFDDPVSITPRGHVYVSEQLPWLKLADDLPRFATTSAKDGSKD